MVSATRFVFVEGVGVVLHSSLGVRVEALGLLVAGGSAGGVGLGLGVPSARVARWARLAGMRFAPGSRSGLLCVGAPGVVGAGGGHGRRLLLADRSLIQTGREQGLSMRRIAALVGVAPSTVSREIARSRWSYRGAVAV